MQRESNFYSHVYSIDKVYLIYGTIFVAIKHNAPALVSSILVIKISLVGWFLGIQC